MTSGNRTVSMFRVSMTLVLLTTFPMTLRAQDTVQPSQSSGSDEIVPLAEGDSAPYDGMLFPVETAVRWRQRIELLSERLRLDVERCEETALIRQNLLEETLRLRRNQYDEDREELREAVVRAGEPTFGERLWAVGAPILGLLVGAAVGVLVGLAVGG